MAGARSEMARQALVRYIVDMQLKPGDRLPSQTELRKQLSVGSTTVSNAIQSLNDDGIVELRDKMGVFVKKTNLDGHTGRNIGILINSSNSIFTHILVSSLQKELQNESCNAVMFICPPDKDSKKLSNFPGLLRNIRQQNLAGLLITCELFSSEYHQLNKKGVSCLSTMDITPEVSCCGIDFKRYMKEAFTYLTSRGARRPVLISRGYHRKNKCAKVFADLLKQLNPKYDYKDYYYVTPGFEQARDTAEKLLALREEKRPDALIFNGDVVMQGVYTWLYRLQAGKEQIYLPSGAAILNKQNPIMPLSDHVAIFELDIFEIANQAVSILMENLRTNTGITRKKIAPKMVSEREYFENSRASQKIYD